MIGVVIELLNRHEAALSELCRRFDVRRLELFGSAADGRFDSTRSDLDFLVEFESTDYHGASDRYFGLMEELERLFERHVDLLEIPAIKNPYFLRGIAASRTVLYAA
jgi:predicted nucleotidyltransferase